jgi:hypothetical protein
MARNGRVARNGHGCSMVSMCRVSQGLLDGGDGKGQLAGRKEPANGHNYPSGHHSNGNHPNGNHANGHHYANGTHRNGHGNGYATGYANGHAHSDMDDRERCVAMVDVEAGHQQEEEKQPLKQEPASHGTGSSGQGQEGGAAESPAQPGAVSESGEAGTRVAAKMEEEEEPQVRLCAVCLPAVPCWAVCREPGASHGHACGPHCLCSRQKDKVVRTGRPSWSAKGISLIAAPVAQKVEHSVFHRGGVATGNGRRSFFSFYR